MSGNKKLLAVMRQRETPVPIPNTMVKPLPADDTWLETVRESRWPPDKKCIWFISGSCVRVPYIWTADKTADVYIENFIQKDI